MRLTTFTDYTLRVLMFLTVKHQTGELATIDEISRAYDISKNHLMKIVHHLSLNGFIVTSRGRAGGARLARDPSQISVGQVVRLCEPDFAIVECHEEGKQPTCAVWQACNLKSAFRRALDAFLMELDRLTLADSVTTNSVAASLLGLELGTFRSIPIRAAAAAPAERTAPARRAAPAPKRAPVAKRAPRTKPAASR
ncbi:RrF2 family transcriptional regulator [Inhella proteolytica]|uniref:Rrf2 family transcriptional regulator n=1 Tax=Inhella proteolytica TaxID=2795029 RepID=A0A931J8F3_9BURK|nr:Rrf2 family transcriptional regulator [Inhella proteolytica]MBH9578697.1 Rrf2 family transcriptional regulator [Inhella proteolytica]